MLPGHTAIDLFERFAQTFYCFMLLVKPAYWLEDNFKNPPTDATTLALVQVMGVMVMCLWLCAFQIRLNGVGLKLGDFLSAFCWGCCVFVTYNKQELYNDHAFKTNMGLQSSIVAVFLYQGLTRGEEGGKKKSS